MTFLVADVARSVEFYRGLGLVPIVGRADPDGVAGYARLAFPEGDGTLSLERHAAGGGGGGAGGGGGTVVFFECDGLDARVASLTAAGYRFDGPPETKPWMWREAHLVDPDGHRLCLLERGSYRLDPPWRLPGSGVPTATAVAAGGPDDADLAWLHVDRNRGYLDAAIPSARDERIAALLAAVAEAPPAAREAIADRVATPHTPTLIAFAERMACLAVRANDAAYARRGLCAIGLAWRNARDVRAAIPPLGALYDAAGRAGADPGAVFRAAARDVPADVAPVLEDFLRRDDLDEIAETMGYLPRADRDGFRYLRAWGGGKADAESDSDVGGGE